MAEEDAGEKTEDATQRRRDEFRERGQIAKSQDVLSLLILSVGLSYFIFFGTERKRTKHHACIEISLFVHNYSYHRVGSRRNKIQEQQQKGEYVCRMRHQRP